MPTIFAHALIPCAMKLGAGKKMSVRLWFAAVVACVMPDADVVAFRLGIAYADDFGHRGASHSIAFAIIIGLIALIFAKPLRATKLMAFIVVFLSTLSHPLLDMLTNGGLGAALYWPIENARQFFDWRPIQVSPIGRAFFSERGLAVLLSEARYVGIAALSVFIAFLTARRWLPNQQSA
jgi:inner membrane protein